MLVTIQIFPQGCCNYTNTAYLKFYKRFSVIYQEDNVLQMWADLQETYESRLGSPVGVTTGGPTP